MGAAIFSRAWPTLAGGRVTSPTKGRPFRALLPIALVLIGVPWGLKLSSTPELGASCEGGFDCAVIEGRCVQGKDGRFCTKVCTDDAQCPSNSHCGIPPHDIHQVEFSVSPVSERFCIPGPRPAKPPSLDDFQRAAPAAAAPKPEHVGVH